MYVVIGTPRSRAMRVMWMLEELEQPYEVVAPPLGSDAQRDATPEGRVPALRTPDGVVLTDSVAIMTYLADRHADRESGPTYAAGTIERAVQDGHTQFVDEALDGPLWVLSKHRYVLPKALRAAEAVAPAALHDLEDGFERLAARVGDGPFLMGARFTVPDIMAGHCGGWAKVAGVTAPEPAAAYLKRVYARPSNARARARAAEALRAAGLD